MISPFFSTFGVFRLKLKGFRCERMELVGEGWARLSEHELRDLRAFVAKQRLRRSHRLDLAPLPFHLRQRAEDQVWVECDHSDFLGRFRLQTDDPTSVNLSVDEAFLRLDDPEGPLQAPTLILWGQGEAAILVPSLHDPTALLLARGSVDAGWRQPQAQARALIEAPVWHSLLDKGEGTSWLPQALADASRGQQILAPLVTHGMAIRSHQPATAVGKLLRMERRVAGEVEPTRESLRRWARSTPQWVMLAALASAAKLCHQQPIVRRQGGLIVALHARDDVACVIASVRSLVEDGLGRIPWMKEPPWLEGLADLKHRLVVFDRQLVEYLDQGPSGANNVVSDRLAGVYKERYAPHFAELVNIAPSEGGGPEADKTRLMAKWVARRDHQLEGERSLKELYQELEWHLFTSAVAPRMFLEALARVSANPAHLEIHKKLKNEEGRPEERYARMHSLGVSASTLLGLAHLKRTQESCAAIAEHDILGKIREREAQLLLSHKQRVRSEAGVRGLDLALEKFDPLHDYDFSRHVARWQQHERWAGSETHLTSRAPTGPKELKLLAEQRALHALQREEE